MSNDRLSTATVYPESENKFFMKDVDVQIEFSNEGSLTLFENGKIDWTAKKK